jgi:hypothetical protein
MQTMKLLLSFLTLTVIHTSLFAQEKKILKDKHHSATVVEEKQLEFLESQKEALSKFELPTSIGMIEIPVKVHVVRSSKETAPLSIDEVKKAIAKLNKHFIHIYIQFVPLGDFNYIRNDKYYILDKEKENDLCAPHDIENVINLYIVGDIVSGPTSFCGYTHLPTGLKDNVDRILMAKDCFNDGVALARQMGHHFTLFGTSGIHQSETNEWVNGSNCKTEGDQICDTPADPGLTLSSVDQRCGYIGKKKDQSGRRRFYQPDMYNLMSNNPRLYCCKHFSPQQYKRMMYTALNIRNYLTFPKSEYSRKQLRTLAEEKGIQGEVNVYIQGKPMTARRDKNMYINEEYTYPSSTPYKMSLTYNNKGYVYVLEGDNERGIYLQYPLKGDKVFFNGKEPATFMVPSGDKMLEVDELKGEGGKNHIVILFSKKQLRIVELIDQMNSIEEEMDVVQRIYSIIGTDLIPAKNLVYDKKGAIKVAGIATDQQIMPVIIEYKQQ